LRKRFRGFSKSEGIVDVSNTMEQALKPFSATHCNHNFMAYLMQVKRLNRWRWSVLWIKIWL